MKSILSFTLKLLVASACVAQAAPLEKEPPTSSAAPSLADYKLVWSDEFDGTALDTSKWDYRTDSKHWSTQKPENVAVRDGKLILTGKKEAANGKDYTGSGVISKLAFKYGYYEARFKTPPGAGWHTSFWMMKHSGSGGTDTGATKQEINVCENNSVAVTSYNVNCHRWNPEPPKSYGRKKVQTPNLSADFHVYSCEFTPKSIKFFFDGKLARAVQADSVEGRKMEYGDQNVWLTLLGSRAGGTKAVDDGKLPAIAEYDWVRFYEKK